MTKSVVLVTASRTGIRLNPVAPGPIQTEMFDRFTGGEAVKTYLANFNARKRVGRREGTVNAVLYLDSDRPSFVTSHILTVDGGKSAG
jgi:NAD(P)-dependent dehydrogenase (short-subunit alcohol dehydrogenase family)